MTFKSKDTNENKKEQTQAAEYGFYSRLLKTDFDTVAALKEAEAAYLAEQEKKAARMEVGMARTRADLERIAKERGYDRKWVWVQCQIKKIRW
jgi:hypothetical protein